MTTTRSTPYTCPRCASQSITGLQLRAEDGEYAETLHCECGESTRFAASCHPADNWGADWAYRIWVSRWTARPRRAWLTRLLYKLTPVQETEHIWGRSK